MAAALRDELSGKLLDQLLSWSSQEQARWMADLRRLAAYKYDRYEGFAAGERFFESLAGWLGQFPDPDARRRLTSFVRSELVFVSRDEINHVIACAYPDFIRPMLIKRVGDETSTSRFRVHAITSSRAFRSLRRKTLYLGLSDGARLDRLRRSNPELSHEQFWLSPELGDLAISSMRTRLGEAITEQDLEDDPSFREVVFVDDFYGSGFSLLHPTDETGWGGKLARARDHVDTVLSKGPTALLAGDARITVVVYLASAQAKAYMSSILHQFDATWHLLVVQTLPDDLPVSGLEMINLCEWFFDDALIDKHKPNRVPLGYQSAALPLILEHNTPNNSISLLWADTSAQANSKQRHALFPRYERHHQDRP